MDVSADLWKTYSKMDPVSLEDLLFEVMQVKCSASVSPQSKSGVILLGFN